MPYNIKRSITEKYLKENPTLPMKNMVLEKNNKPVTGKLSSKDIITLSEELDKKYGTNRDFPLAPTPNIKR